jgi:hypothetical protein
MAYEKPRIEDYGTLRELTAQSSFRDLVPAARGGGRGGRSGSRSDGSGSISAAIHGSTSDHDDT